MRRLDAPRVLEYPLESLLEPVNVVVDQVLLVDFALVDETHERQTLVHLSQVQHNVLSRVLVRKPDERAALLVELAAAPFFVDAVDASHVDQHVD